MGLTAPVLHDRAQLVARAYKVSAAPEAMLVSRGGFPSPWVILYRGALSSPAGPAAGGAPLPVRTCLADALATFVAGSPLQEL